jgi:microcystin-dependent protein
MADPFIAEIRILGCKFAPTGWAQCNGQLLPVAQNTVLFALLGTSCGGDGTTTFALPDLRGRGAVHAGERKEGNPVPVSYQLGERGGSASVTLQVPEMPSHPHTVQGNITAGNLAAPSSARCFARASPGVAYWSDTEVIPLPEDPPLALTQFALEAVGPAGGGKPHDNMMPYLVLNFCIAMQGLFPPHN